MRSHKKKKTSEVNHHNIQAQNRQEGFLSPSFQIEENLTDRSTSSPEVQLKQLSTFKTFADISLRPQTPNISSIQREITVTEPDNKYEKEADQVASEVVGSIYSANPEDNTGNKGRGNNQKSVQRQINQLSKYQRTILPRNDTIERSPFLPQRQIIPREDHQNLNPFKKPNSLLQRLFIQKRSDIKLNQLAMRANISEGESLQRVIVDEVGRPFRSRRLTLALKNENEDIKNIILGMNNDPLIHYTLNDALMSARETGDGEDVSREENTITSLKFPEEDSEDEDYIPLESESASASRKRGKKRRAKQEVETYETGKHNDNKKRRTPVKIIREKVIVQGNEVMRPVKVIGKVIPMPTKGRGSAPEPDTGLKVSVKSKDVGRADTRNTGISDAQKGHLMALELGGPDIGENIVAQWAQFQSNGLWRKAEIKVLNIAKEQIAQDRTVTYICDIHYKKYKEIDQGTQKGLLMPKGFTMTVEIYDANKNLVETKVVFDQDQSQDKTDDKLAYRIFDKADSLESTSTDYE